jgi:iron complex transport system substrate-binding protein
MTRFCRFGLLAAPVATALILAGCKPAPAPLPASSASSPRIISLAPSITEIVYALNAGNQLIGRSSACDYPPAAVSNVPVIGDFGVPSLERIVALRPDQVLYTDVADPLMDSKMKRVGLHPVHVACARLADIPPAIIQVGQLIHREAEARTMASNLVGQIELARQQATAFTHRPRVLVLIWHDPFYAAGGKSFVSDLIALAGGQNIGNEIDRDYFQASSEWVLAHDPDIVFCFFMASSTPVRNVIMRQPGWSHLKAVRDGRVYDGFDNNVALRPGPRVMQGLEVIKKQIHE